MDDDLWEGSWEVRTFESMEEITDGELGEFSDRYMTFKDALAACGGSEIGARLKTGSSLEQADGCFYTIGKDDGGNDGWAEWVATIEPSGVVTEVTDCLYLLPKEDRGPGR